MNPENQNITPTYPQNPVVPSPLPTAPPPEPTKRNTITIIIMVVFILAAVVIAIGGYYYVMQQTKVEIDLSDKSPEPTTTVPQDPIDTTGWQTYTNQALGFTMKYPPSWGPEKCPEGYGNPNTLCTDIVEDNPTEPVFYVIGFSQESPRESVEGIGKITYTNETINGIEAMRTDGLPSRAGGDTIFFKKSDGTYVTVGFYPYADHFPEVDKYHAEFNQMLSTFTFKGQEVDTKNWKTYTDANYGFSLKYPETWNKITEESYPGALEPTSVHLGPNLPCKSLECNTFAGIVINEYANSENLNAKSYAQKTITDVAKQYAENNLPAPQIVINPPVSPNVDIAFTKGWMGAAGPGPVAIINKDGVIIEISSDSIDEALVYKIFSTFKFTNDGSQ